MAGDQKTSLDTMAVTADRADFDTRSGSRLERLIFNHRWPIVLVCLVITVLMGWRASKLEVNASFERMIPQSQPYIRNYLDNADALRGLGNSVRVVVENTSGDIYDPAYLQTLQKVSDTLFLMPGVDRSFMKSLWTPTVRWMEITEEGFRGGPVMPDDYHGSRSDLDSLRRHVLLSGSIGSIVSNDQHSSMVIVPLLDTDVATGKPLDYKLFSRRLEQTVRSLQTPTTRIYIVGFAKLAGDLIEGMNQVLGFFGVAALIAAVVILGYTRCVRSTAIVLVCSMIAVIWQMGSVQLLGYALDPYSILVPFLVFAIGVSHGAQKMNGIMQDIARGTHRYIAARYTFRRLFLAGLTALVADAVGFGVLMMIDIPVIRVLALTASIGVALLVFTNLILAPVMFSFVGVSKRAAARSVVDESDLEHGRGISGRIVDVLCLFTRRRYAVAALGVAAVIFALGLATSFRLQIGDLDPGAPELRVDSRYNRDGAFIAAHFGLSSDQFAVIVKTPAGGTGQYPTLVEMDRLEAELGELPGVQSTKSAAGVVRMATVASYEGNPKWMAINRDPFVSGDVFNNVIVSNPELSNQERSVAPVVAYLQDHKAATLTRVVDAVEAFAKRHDSPDRQFLLAGGSAGIDAATNIAVSKANHEMLALLYFAVAVLCFVTFRSWRAVIVAVVPLAMTSVLCEALMVLLGIGVKVATLPVIALGVGIGVDYALYLLAVQLALQRRGVPLEQAYRETVGFTGKVVGLVGITLAGGVITWALSPIKFQADMGILLTFMFLWNMLGALILIPALSHFLLRDVKVSGRQAAAPRRGSSAAKASLLKES